MRHNVLLFIRALIIGFTILGYNNKANAGMTIYFWVEDNIPDWCCGCNYTPSPGDNICSNAGGLFFYEACTISCDFSTVQCTTPGGPGAPVPSGCPDFSNIPCPAFECGSSPCNTSPPIVVSGDCDSPDICPQAGSDPFVIPTGNMVHSFKLFQSPSLGKLNFNTSIEYHSLSTLTGSTGIGTGLSTDMQLKVLPVTFGESNTISTYAIYEGGIIKSIFMSGDYWSTIRGGGITSFFGSGSGQLYNYNSGIAYTSTDGITSWFNTESERITAQTDGTGAAKYYNYDSYGKLVSVNDSVGRTVLYGYANTTSTLINTITDPNGNVYRLNYDSYNHLTQIIYPNSSTKQLSYDSNGQLTSIVDENGNMASYAYNSGGTLTAYYGPSGFGTFQVVNVGAQNINGQSCNGTGIIYDISNAISPQYWWLKNNLVNSNQPVIEQVGNVQLCKECGIVAGIPWAGIEGIQWSGYDSLGNLISQTDYNENLTTWSGYDYNGDYQTMTTACGSPVSSIYGTPYSSTTEYRWNARLHQPTSIITKSVLVNKSGPNQANKVTYYNYNSANELLSITQTGYTFNSYGNIAGYSYTTFYSYDNAGNLTGISDANGSATHYNRDRMGNITSIANALNQTTYYSNYDNMGHTGTVTDPNGNVSNITYNWRGQVTSITQKAASSTGTDLTTIFSYNVKGNVSEITYPSGAYILYSYDAGDHVTNITKYNSLGQSFGSIVYTYDFKGNETSENVYDAQSNLVRLKDYIDDQYNTLAKIINGYTSTTYYDYDGNGNLSSKTDSNGNLINYQYNELNKLGRVVQYLGSPYDPYGSQANALTAYMYNLHGDLITATDANGNISNYTYDDMGRLVTVNSPDTGITRYWYDPNGNLIGKVDADGRTLNYNYDGLSRLTNVIDISNPKNAIVTYYYDGQNPLNIPITNGIGRLTGMHDSSGDTAYSYDVRGNIIQETRSISGHTFVVSYSYDDDGNLASETYPSGRVVIYSYTTDPDNPSSVSAMVNDVNTIIANNITYQAFGGLSGLMYGNGLPLTATTDATGEITNIQVGNIINRAYDVDNAGNVLTITTSPSSDTYNYDALNRVTDSTGDYGDIEYFYDLVGNRLTQVTSTKTINYVYYPGTNKLWSYNDPIKGGNENSIKWDYKKLIESWEHLIENGKNRRCIEDASEGNDVDSWNDSNRDEDFKDEDIDHGKQDTDKVCYTYATLVNTMLDAANAKHTDLQTFVGLLMGSDEIKTDLTDIVNRVNSRGVNATLEKKDIKLFKHLFKDMEEIIDHMKGLNPADPTFVYDAAGYIIGESESGMQLQYDILGRLTQVSETITQGSSGPGNKVTTTVTTIGQYTYDGMNRRVTKTTGGVTTIFIYDIYNNLIGEYDANTGSTNKEYVYLGSKPLAMITDPVPSSSLGCGTINTGCSTVGISLMNRGSMGAGAFDGFIYLFPLIGIAIIRLNRSAKRRKLDIIGLLSILGMVILVIMVSKQSHAQVSGEQVYYYHLDHLGTPIEMTDASQNIVWQASYDPFGQATTSVSTVTNNLRFPGMYADSETGLYYNMNRYYYPAIGRYIEPEPLNFANTYIYLLREINYIARQFLPTSSGVPIGQIELNQNSYPLSNLLLLPSLQMPYPYAINNPTGWIDPSGQWGIGVIGGGSAEAGIGVGAGNTGFIGGGIFWGGPQGANWGGFAGGGSMIGGPGFGANAPNGSGTKGGVVIGFPVGTPYIGGGVGGYITNAKCAGGLGGPFDTWTVNTPWFSVQYSKSDNGTWIGSVTYSPPGVSYGAGGSNYPTYTWPTK